MEKVPGSGNKAIIHVQFRPDGTVIGIGENPEGVFPQDWFNFLSRNTVNSYTASTGGRGYFVLDPAFLESLREQAEVLRKGEPDEIQ